MTTAPRTSAPVRTLPVLADLQRQLAVWRQHSARVPVFPASR